jgi:hypothetical protein
MSNVVLAGGNGVVSNSTNLEKTVTPGRWHHIRISAMPGGLNGTGTCSVWVNGVVVSEKDSCPLAKLFDYCVSTGTLKVEVGSFDG